MKGWNCPRCGRQFARARQWHSCQTHKVADHFRGRPKQFRETFDTLIARLKQFGPLRVDPIKTMIHFFARKHCFGGVFVTRDHMRVRFMVDRPIRDPRIHRAQRITTNRVAYSVKTTSPADIDEQLLDWLRAAYEMQS